MVPLQATPPVLQTLHCGQSSRWGSREPVPEEDGENGEGVQEGVWEGRVEESNVEKRGYRGKGKREKGIIRWKGRI